MRLKPGLQRIGHKPRYPPGSAYFDVALDDCQPWLLHCPACIFAVPSRSAQLHAARRFLITAKSSQTLVRPAVILILQNKATDDQVAHVLARVEELGLKHHLSRGTHRTIVGIIGDEDKLREEPLRAISGVAEVIPVLPPYKLASIDAHPDPSVIDVSGVKIGGGNLAMIAGPCSVEEPDRMFRIAESVADSGANLFRGGAFKPRTSPYAFQGMGEDGLKLASRSRR